MATHTWTVNPHIITHHPEDGMVVLQVLSNLVPQLGWYVYWMYCITLYWLYPKFDRTYPHIHRTCRMGGDNISMACSSPHHNTQHREDGMMVLHLLTSMLQQLRCYAASIDIITVYWLCPKIVWHSSCNHEAGWAGGNTYMVYGSSCSCNNPHYLDDGMVVYCSFLQIEIWSHI